MDKVFDLRELEAKSSRRMRLASREWISVEERLPEASLVTYVIGGCEFQVEPVFWTGGRWIQDAEHPADWVTYWMPLPEPPKP